MGFSPKTAPKGTLKEKKQTIWGQVIEVWSLQIVYKCVTINGLYLENEVPRCKSSAPALRDTRAVIYM